MSTTHNDASYHPYGLHSLRKIPQIHQLSDDLIHAIEVVGQVLPFRTNSYVLEHLIDWDNIPDDPMFKLTFPQQDMLSELHFQSLSNAIANNMPQTEIEHIVNQIRFSLNPHPAGQLEHNVPILDGDIVQGVQHKYGETALFFPREGQTCHAYCTWCFRWPQFVNLNDLKFASDDVNRLINYLRKNPSITDLLITGGDPLIMRTSRLKFYIDAILEANLPNLQTIRFGSKSLTYWPYRYLTDKDADELLRLFEKIVASGKHLAFMAHINHPRELAPQPVHDAVQRIRNTGAMIRTQSPVLRNVNADAELWAEMWRKQVALGMVPYYFFVARDTGAQDYFAVPLIEAYEIFRDAYSAVSGVARTVRGPSMSATPGKIQILGTTKLYDDTEAFILQYIQARNPEFVNRPFMAKYDPDAIWFNQLEPLHSHDSHFFPHLQQMPVSPHGVAIREII